MTPGLTRASIALAALLFSLLSTVVVHRFAPEPSADSAGASEEAFAEGLEEREFFPPMMGPGRWTGGTAAFEFENLPEGPVSIEVRVHNHQDPVRVLVERLPTALIAEGERGIDLAAWLEEGDDNIEIDLVVKPFLARGGRRLGTFFDKITVVHERTLLPPADLFPVFIGPAIAIVAGALFAGVRPFTALGISCAASAAQGALLLPWGIVRSDYAYSMAALLALGALLVGLSSRRRPELFVALLAAFLVQGIAALSPLVIGLDASFHGHNLADVRQGDYFIASETQHKPPFRFPYGVAFYAPLVPFALAGFDLIEIVRAGASISGALLSAALFWLVARGTGRLSLAAASVVLLQLVPWSFDVYSNGNYSNIYAQMVVVVFLCWWTAGKPFGWPAGAALFAVGALAHLSGFFFLLALGAGLLFVHRRDLAAERPGLVALGVGLAAALVYYAQFTSLVLDQLPRLLEAGRGGTGDRSLLESIRAQVEGALVGWGPPVILLALVGRPRGEGRLDRDLRAVWLAGALLALAAVATPVEVRYLYALSVPLAIAAAMGTARLLEGGLASKLAAATLVAAQLSLAAFNIAKALLHDWRA